MDIEIRSVTFAGQPCRTRLPFRFGVVTLTRAPVLTARVEALADGAPSVGFAADLCVPRWFDKDPSRSPHDDVRALFASARRAGNAFEGRRGSAFGIWWDAHRACVTGPEASGVALVDGFGVALVERALIDATCRAARATLRDALRLDLLGFDAGTLLPELAGTPTGALAAAERRGHVLVRHTVGGLDPLRSEDVPSELRGDDGHPVALEEDIARFDLRAFKLKAGGDPGADALRLQAIGRVVGEAGVAAPLYTLDANEQYPDLDRLGELLDLLEGDADGRALLAGLEYVEQPLPRARTRDARTRDGVAAISRQVPLIIDEADDGVDAFRAALDLGYRGVSVKNCKGFFRTLANRALCLARGDAFQTSEDLTNLPVLPLQQDLTTVELLGLRHSERNGHHFFPGLDVVSDREAHAARATQPDLYTQAGERTVLRIEDGALSLACADAVGYGYASEIDWAARQPLTTLEQERLV